MGRKNTKWILRDHQGTQDVFGMFSTMVADIPTDILTDIDFIFNINKVLNGQHKCSGATPLYLNSQ